MFESPSLFEVAIIFWLILIYFRIDKLVNLAEKRCE